MKLSQAIREGSKTTTQCYEIFFSLTSEDGMQVREACALGAAAYAMGAKFGGVQPILQQNWPWLGNTKSNCPACVGGPYSLQQVIFHLNDDHKWTREAIADWVAGEEDKLELKQLLEQEEKQQELVEV